MAWGQAIAQGIGRTGNELSQATDQNIDRAIKIIQSKLELGMLQERVQQMQAKQPQGMVGTPGGGTAGVTFDPRTETYGSQPIVAGAQGAMPTSQDVDKLVSNLPEGPQRELYRGALSRYVTLGDVEGFNRTATQMAERFKPTSPSKLTKGDLIPDPESSTGYSRLMLDGQGNVQKKVPNVIVPGLVPKVHQGWTVTTDADGNVIQVPTTSTTGPVTTPQRFTTATKRPSTAAPVTDKPTLPGGARVIGHKPTKEGGAAAQNALTGLKVLEVSLFGDSTATDPVDRSGLKDTLKVLDSTVSRAKVQMFTEDPSKHWGITKQLMIPLSKTLTPEENAYIAQFNRAVSAINALRSITGLPRSTQALMERYMRELADPVTTPSSKVGEYRLRLIKRELDAARSVLNARPGGVSDVDKQLQEILK